MFLEDMFILIFIAFMLPELGHMLAIWCCGLKIEKIKFIGFGLEISTNYKEINKKIIINLAGPIMNLFIIIICSIFIKLYYIKYFIKINFWIFLINILPVIPLDGSKILETVLDKKIGIIKSKKTLVNISIIFVITFIIIGVIKCRYNIILIGIYIIKKIKEEIDMSKLNGIERIINRKERFLKKGFYPVRHVAVLVDGMVNDVLQKLDFDNIHIINVLDRDLNIIALLNEEQIINQLVEKGTSITFNDIVKHV